MTKRNSNEIWREVFLIPRSMVERLSKELWTNGETSERSISEGQTNTSGVSPQSRISSIGSPRWDSCLKLGARLQAIHYEFRRYARVIRACEDRDLGLADQTERDSSELRYHSLCGPSSKKRTPRFPFARRPRFMPINYVITRLISVAASLAITN